MAEVILNKPTELGWEAGKHIARFYDVEFAKQKEVFPNQKDKRCGSCAFREGTIPNGCESSIMDALKCVIEMKEFGCHEAERNCFGWLILATSIPEDFPLKEVRWEFSEGVERGTREDAYPKK